MARSVKVKEVRYMSEGQLQILSTESCFKISLHSELFLSVLWLYIFSNLLSWSPCFKANMFTRLGPVPNGSSPKIGSDQHSDYWECNHEPVWNRSKMRLVPKSSHVTRSRSSLVPFRMIQVWSHVNIPFVV